MNSPPLISVPHEKCTSNGWDISSILHYGTSHDSPLACFRNRSYRYSQYGTGNSSQIRLIRGMVSNADDTYLFLMIYPLMSLHCKLVPVHTENTNIYTPWELALNINIGGFHMTSLNFKLQNYWSSWDFTFMMYKSSWKLIFRKFSLRMGSWFSDGLRLNF